jgi:phosphatidate cytidylyltransferase
VAQRSTGQTRVISGALLLAAVFGALWFLPPIYLVAIAVVVALIAFREYRDIAARAGVHISGPAGAAAVALMCVVVAMPGLPIEAALAATTLGLAALALAAALTAEPSMAESRMNAALPAAAIAAFAPAYLGVPLGLLAATRWMLGREAALLLIIAVAASDTCQYYSGRLFGRRPLAPVVSPKKTVEGALGGFVGAVLALGLIGYWWLPQMSLPARALLGCALAAVGIVGDLFESLLKRSVNVKDASSVIPGHGGVLDRIDALLFAAPVFYVFVRYSL